MKLKNGQKIGFLGLNISVLLSKIFKRQTNF